MKCLQYSVSFSLNFCDINAREVVCFACCCLIDFLSSLYYTGKVKDRQVKWVKWFFLLFSRVIFSLADDCCFDWLRVCANGRSEP